MRNRLPFATDAQLPRIAEPERPAAPMPKGLPGSVPKSVADKDATTTATIASFKGFLFTMCMAACRSCEPLATSQANLIWNVRDSIPRQPLACSTAFNKQHLAIGRHCRELLSSAGWPAHADSVHTCRRAQTKMQTKIVLRNIARLTEDGLSLDGSGCLDPDSRADGAPIGFGSFKAKLNPMVRTGKIISQQ